MGFLRAEALKVRIANKIFYHFFGRRSKQVGQYTTGRDMHPCIPFLLIDKLAHNYLTYNLNTTRQQKVLVMWHMRYIQLVVFFWGETATLERIQDC